MKTLRYYIPFYKRNLAIAVPIMLAQAGQMSVQLVDSIMVGHFGTTELAAASFASSIYVVGFVLGMGFSLGVTPLIGEVFGKKDYKRVGELSINSVVLNLIFSVFLSIILYFTQWLMPYMGQDPNVLATALPYYRILIYSLPPILIFFIFKQILEGFGNTKVASYITLIANIINIFLNYLFIFGHWGCPTMGLEGAGWATFSARVLMLIFIVIYIYHSKYFRQFSPYIFLKDIQFKELKSLFKFSFPIGLQMIIEVLAFALGSIMAGWFGETALAAHQIALGLASFTFMIASGIGSAATIKVSHQLGAGKYREMRMAGFASMHLAVIFMSFTAIIFILFNHQLSALFTNDSQVIDMAAYLLLFAAVFQILDGIQVTSISILRGLQDIRFTLIGSLLTYGLVSISFSYLLSTKLEFQTPGVWIGYILGLLAAGIVFSMRFNHLSLKRLKKALV